MAQYLPGRIHIVFRPGVTFETAIECLKSAGLADPQAVEPSGPTGMSVRLQTRIAAGTEAEWVERISVLEEVEICARTVRQPARGPSGPSPHR
ncbi:MAG TPA: hypothetical protein VL283_03715 [Candidatus Baltobacteraceae bacterium]|nr:hypothetical protein [Candidatus Baltobacteraceae bacterium]